MKVAKQRATRKKARAPAKLREPASTLRAQLIMRRAYRIASAYCGYGVRLALVAETVDAGWRVVCQFRLTINDSAYEISAYIETDDARSWCVCSWDGRSGELLSVRGCDIEECGTLAMLLIMADCPQENPRG